MRGPTRAVCLISLTALANCGGENAPEPATTAAAPTSTIATTPPIATTPTLPVGEPAGWIVSGSDDRGYSQTATMSFGPPEKADPTATESLPSLDDDGDLVYERLIKACPVDPATDAVVRVTITLDNTTAQFPEVLGMGLYQGGPSSSIKLASDEEFGDSGPTCTTPQASGDFLYGLKPNQPVEPGGVVLPYEFSLVLYNYYSPANPNGDIASYQATQLRPQLVFGPDGDERRVDAVLVANTSAPGAPTPQLVAG